MSRPKDEMAKDLGFQLYTLREVLSKNPRQVLERVAKIGYKEVEVLRASLEQLAPIFTDLHLDMISGHFETPIFTGDWSAWRAGSPPDQLPPKGYDLNAAIDQAKRHGLRYIVVPYLQPAERKGPDLASRLADHLNRAGEACKKAGLKLCYHNHAFEFAPRGGTPLFETLLQKFDKDLVGIELDIFWASVAGHDPVRILTHHPGRFPLIHLKDKAKGTPVVYNEWEVSPKAFKEVGNGVLDIPAVLKAASESGVEHCIVEQDQCQGDPVDSLRQSFENWERLSKS